MAKDRSKPSDDDALDDPHDEYLSLFVRDEKGKARGETIGVEGTDLVLKDGGDFYKIPLSSVKMDGKYLTIVKYVNWKISRSLGEKWKEKELDPL